MNRNRSSTKWICEMDGDTVLAHCWAESYLTETFAAAIRAGKTLAAICTETRPYLQAARLTAESLAEIGVDTTVITEEFGVPYVALVHEPDTKARTGSDVPSRSATARTRCTAWEGGPRRTRPTASTRPSMSLRRGS